MTAWILCLPFVVANLIGFAVTFNDCATKPKGEKTRHGNTTA